MKQMIYLDSHFQIIVNSLMFWELFWLNSDFFCEQNITWNAKDRV